MRHPTVTALAQPRIASSSRPDWFLLHLHATAALVRSGEDVASASWTANDPIALAAEIEALAGLRRLAAAGHRITCRCDVCRVQHHAAEIARRNGQ